MSSKDVFFNNFKADYFTMVEIVKPLLASNNGVDLNNCEQISFSFAVAADNNSYLKVSFYDRKQGIRPCCWLEEDKVKEAIKKYFEDYK